MFQERSLAEILNTNSLLVTIGCVNYEERSIETFSKIIKNAKKHKNLSDIRNEILYLKNASNNNFVLEELKQKYKTQLDCQIISATELRINDWIKIEYPNNFNIDGLLNKLHQKLLEYSKSNNIDLHIDISVMPRQIIFNLCKAISNWVDDSALKINRIYFTYVTPNEYSSIPYAQEIGSIKGLFTGEQITLLDKKEILTIIFPSITGHEGKLITDWLNQITYDHKCVVYLPIETRNFLNSLEIMRANQILTQQNENAQKYYCSLSDAIHDLYNYLLKEELDRQKNTYNQDRLYLVAPFGAKIILPISYFILTNLKKHDVSNSIQVEICNSKSFQYTSVYSIGVGAINSFEVDLEKWKE